MVHFHKLKVAHVARETDDAVAITFAVPEELRDAYRFTQGQHLTIRATINGEEVRRTYSICAGVDDEWLRIGVKRIAGGAFSSFANDDLKPGAELDVMTPIGKFHTDLDADARRTYAAFVAGSGITPVLSIIKTTLAREPGSRFVLVFGNRTTGSIMFREDIEDLKNRYMGRFSVIHVLSREEQDMDLFNGRIDADKVRALSRGVVPVSAVDEYFLCGPETMIHDVRDTLVELGVDRNHIHFELFHTDLPATVLAKRHKPAPVETDRDVARVAVIVNGARTEFDMPLEGDGSVLEAALDHGADLPFSCKGGVCSTCRCKVMEGKVDMAVNYALEDHEVDAGFVLSCQSHPLTDTLVLDFDAQ
ncbi:MAG: 1,2-phenylacetyl-CoA epoxidase subunit PaaE [Sphingomonadales bacterium]